jgi:hypothetical protein
MFPAEVSQLLIGEDAVVPGGFAGGEQFALQDAASALSIEVI